MSKYVGAGNSKIVARNQHGGNKKQGLAPCATHYFIANTTGQEYYTETGDGRQRFTLICMNQLGGIGKGRSQFRPNADGERNCDDILVIIIYSDFEKGTTTTIDQGQGDDNNIGKAGTGPAGKPTHIHASKPSHNRAKVIHNLTPRVSSDTPKSIVTEYNTQIFTWFGLYSGNDGFKIHGDGDEIIMIAANPTELSDNKSFGFSYLNTAVSEDKKYNKNVAYIKTNILKQIKKPKISPFGPTGGQLFTNGSITFKNDYITNQELIKLLSASSKDQINTFATPSNNNPDISGGRFLHYWYSQTKNSNAQILKNCGANSDIDVGKTSTFGISWENLTDPSRAEVFLQYNTNGTYNHEDKIYFYQTNTANQGVLNSFTGFTGMNLQIDLHDNTKNQERNYMKSYYGTLSNTQIDNLPQIIKNYTLHKISKSSKNSNFQTYTISKTGT